MNDSRQPCPVFDQYAEQYESELAKGISVSGESRDYFARGRVEWLAKRLRELNRRVRRIMDFRCGTGSAIPFFLEFLEPEEVLGVDVSARSLEVARSLYPSDRIQFASLNEFKPTADFDLVFCNGVFHHIPPPDRLQMVRRIRESLVPNGFFVLWDNNPWNPGARWVMKRIPFDRDAVMMSATQAKTLLTREGFSVIRVDHRFLFPRCLKLLRAIEPALSGLPLAAQYMVLAKK